MPNIVQDLNDSETELADMWARENLLAEQPEQEEPEEEQPEQEEPEEDHLEQEEPEEEQPEQEEPEEHKLEQEEPEENEELIEPEEGQLEGPEAAKEQEVVPEQDDPVQEQEEAIQQEGITVVIAADENMFDGSDAIEVRSGFSNTDNSSNDVFSRLSSHMTGTHKHGGRRAVSVAHSSHLKVNSIFGGGAARTRSWLKISEETPGIKGDPHNHKSIGRTHNPSQSCVSTSDRFQTVTSSGVFRSSRELEAEKIRGHTAFPVGTATAMMKKIGNGSRNDGVSYMGGTTDRFIALHKSGQFRSKRDIAEAASRGQSNQQQTEVFSSFKKSATYGSRKGNGSGFGGSVNRFREQTTNGHFLSSREKKTAEQENKNSGNVASPTYSSFAKSLIKQKKSVHMGGSTGRFVNEKKNGGLVTPGPGAFELQISGKGSFGPVESTNCRPISMLA